MLKKVAQYLAAGTRLVWVIDPDRRTALIFRVNDDVLMHGADGVLDGEDLLPGFTLPLAEVWVYYAPVPPIRAGAGPRCCRGWRRGIARETHLIETRGDTDG